MTEENEGNGEFQSQDSVGVENASDKNEANTDDAESGGRRKWWKKGNKEQRDSKNKERIFKKKSKRKDEKEEEKEVLIEEKNFCINILSEEKERVLLQMRNSEKSYSADKERRIERIRVLETALHEKSQILTQQAFHGYFINNELEQLQKELKQEREANSCMWKVQSDLVRVSRALNEETVLRNMREQQLREKETSLADEKQARLRLQEELRQARQTRVELERRLESFQTKEDTIREQSQLLQQERELKSGLEERVRDMQIQIEAERNRRIATEREVREERINLQHDRENLEREREICQQRIRDSERTVSESQHRLRELQSAVAAAQEALAEYRRLEPRDWIIRRDEVMLSEKNLGAGAWGKVYEGTFRGCQVAVKQIHDLILSPHNRRLFEREMSIASRCRHPHLLQFIGATNDDGSPLFITELLDTDLRNVLRQRSLHHEEVVCIALDIAKGLNYLHLNRPFPIIHRDISSSNVLLWRRDNCWRAKLSDYGAANFMRQHMTSNPGASIYAAPESQTSQQSPKVSTNYYTFQLPFITGKHIFINIKILFVLVNVQTQEPIKFDGLLTNSLSKEANI